MGTWIVRSLMGLGLIVTHVSCSMGIQAPVVSSFTLNRGAASTMNPAITLDNLTANEPTQCMASESPGFAGAEWSSYAAGASFTLSRGIGAKTVYFKVKNSGGESNVVSGTIFLAPERVPVGAGTFTMGRISGGSNDDATYGINIEDPAHEVTLSAYQIGKYEVTNEQFCCVLNWANAKGYLYADAGETRWSGTGDLYAGAKRESRYLIVSFADSDIQYGNGVFSAKTRPGASGQADCPMDSHPMVYVSWYGAAAFCNWLSEWEGLAPCYDMGTEKWPLTIAPPASGGYRLPTEAEWERAAAWDGKKHWIYGFGSDTLTDNTRCNYSENNPMGLASYPYTSPVGWFDGRHKSNNGNVQTANSASPVGAYDMSGNVYEWCNDWYLNTYYSNGGPPWQDPKGPEKGRFRCIRGGAWDDYMQFCRTANRAFNTQPYTFSNLGFRVGKS